MISVSLEIRTLQAVCGLHCAHRESHWEHVTQYFCRRGAYLPTVPELTHMPLCWGISRSVKPDKYAWRMQRWSQGSSCLSKSSYKCRTSALSHPLPFTSPRCLCNPASLRPQQAHTRCCRPDKMLLLAYL